MSRALRPLMPLYAAALGAKNLAYDRGLLRSKRLRRPVISVGNLSVGGAGKTPLVIRLAELLRERGVDVLSRGYGREFSAVVSVQPEGSAAEFGDEPLLIARATGVPVYVGASRYEAGLQAERQSAGLHLLDDGFQHRSLARDVDIVVLHRSDFGGRLLPAGRLREGFASLHRAHIVAMRSEDENLASDLRRRGCNLPIWWMDRRVELPAARRVVAFCAIARPEEFLASLRQQGMDLAATRCWRDHHAYTPADLDELVQLQKQHNAEAFMTTEKDMVRLTRQQRQQLESSASLLPAKLTVRLREEAAAIDGLLALIPAAAMRK